MQQIKALKQLLIILKQNSIPERTIRCILKKYLTHATTTFLPRKGHPVKINNK